MKHIVLSVIEAIRTFFRACAPEDMRLTATHGTAWQYTVDRTRGGVRTVVSHGVIHADAPSSALALLINTGKVYAGEAVKIDGTRYRVWANARPTPIDPASRGSTGDRRRDRERGISR